MSQSDCSNDKLHGMGGGEARSFKGHTYMCACVHACVETKCKPHVLGGEKLGYIVVCPHQGISPSHNIQKQGSGPVLHANSYMN